MGTGRDSPLVILVTCTGSAEPQERLKFTIGQPSLLGAIVSAGEADRGRSRITPSSTVLLHKLAYTSRKCKQKMFFQDRVAQCSSDWHLTLSPASASCAGLLVFKHHTSLLANSFFFKVRKCKWAQRL